MSTVTSLFDSYFDDGKTMEKSFLSLGNYMVLKSVDEDMHFFRTCGEFELYFSKIYIS